MARLDMVHGCERRELTQLPGHGRLGGRGAGPERRRGCLGVGLLRRRFQGARPSLRRWDPARAGIGYAPRGVVMRVAAGARSCCGRRRRVTGHATGTDTGARMLPRGWPQGCACSFTEEDERMENALP